MWPIPVGLDTSQNSFHNYYVTVLKRCVKKSVFLSCRLSTLFSLKKIRNISVYRLFLTLNIKIAMS